VYLGGGIGITVGVLSLLIAVYLGLWALLLGEWGTDKPFPFSKLFDVS
jgi:hypothetical protein